MGLFKSSKTMAERAEDERAKLHMKQLKTAQTRADIEQIRANQARVNELRRIRA